MEKIIGDFDTLIKMDVEEATKVCRLGQGEKCCAFLVMGTTFECCRASWKLLSADQNISTAKKQELRRAILTSGVNL